jgi:hypothetical protein
MNGVRPPSLATWLLQRFDVNDSVVGDLVERFQRRPSVVWYWRQTLTTISVTLRHDIWTHRLLAVRALAIGWAAPWLLLAMLRTPVRNLSSLIGKPIWNWTIENGFDGVRILWFGGLGGVGGPVFLTILVVFATTGWIVGRFHRTHHAALVTLYAASTPVLGATWVYRESALAHPTVALLFVAIPLSSLMGGFAVPRLEGSRA